MRGAFLTAMVWGCAQPVTPFVDDPTVGELRHAGPAEEAVGNFAGRVPCASCDKIKILLSLFQNATDHAPARYQLERVGEDGNARITTRGMWTLATGRPGDAAASIVVLDDSSPPEFARWLSIDNRVLLMLDDTDQLMLGNGAWTYTLSWIDIAQLDALPH